MATTQSNISESIMKQQDIVDLILEDHKPVKELIEFLKDSDNELEERKVAFEDLALLIAAHARPEEDALYEYMKTQEELREDAFEGDVEHVLADQMIEELRRTEDHDMWSARAKVLAELLEHHIEEEEEELLPEVRKETSLEERVKMGRLFIDLKTNILASGGKDIVPEPEALAQIEELRTTKH